MSKSILTPKALEFLRYLTEPKATFDRPKGVGQKILDKLLSEGYIERIRLRTHDYYQLTQLGKIAVEESLN